MTLLALKVDVDDTHLRTKPANNRGHGSLADQGQPHLQRRHSHASDPDVPRVDREPGIASKKCGIQRHHRPGEPSVLWPGDRCDTPACFFAVFRIWVGRCYSGHRKSDLSG